MVWISRWLKRAMGVCAIGMALSAAAEDVVGSDSSIGLDDLGITPRQSQQYVKAAYDLHFFAPEQDFSWDPVAGGFSLEESNSMEGSMHGLSLYWGLIKPKSVWEIQFTYAAGSKSGEVDYIAEAPSGADYAFTSEAEQDEISLAGRCTYYWDRNKEGAFVLVPFATLSFALHDSERTDTLADSVEQYLFGADQREVQVQSYTIMGGAGLATRSTFGRFRGGLRCLAEGGLGSVDISTGDGYFELKDSDTGWGSTTAYRLLGTLYGDVPVKWGSLFAETGYMLYGIQGDGYEEQRNGAYLRLGVVYLW